MTAKPVADRVPRKADRVHSSPGSRNVALLQGTKLSLMR